MRAHQEYHAALRDGRRREIAAVAVRSDPEAGEELVRGQRQQLGEHFVGPALDLGGEPGEHLVRPLRPLTLAAHRGERVGGEERLEALRVHREPVAQHLVTEGDQPVGGLRVHLLAQEVHERVAPVADLVDARGDGAQLAFGTHLVEVHRQCPQQLFGDEVDGPDVGVEEARDVALEEVGVGDEHAAQLELHVERGGQALEQRRVGLDDAHPAADLGQVIRVDHRLPLVGSAADVGVLELPVQDVLDEVVGGLHVARLADRDADRFVAGEACEQELVVAIAEERREPFQDADGVGVPVGLHHLLDHAEEVRHHLLLAVAERLVLEEEQADGEPVLEVLHAEERVDGFAQDGREDGIRGREQAVVRGRVERLDQGRSRRFGEERELPGHGARVGEVLAL